jgi:biotin transport system ATP-binding protein
LLLPDSGQILVNGKNVSKHLVETRKAVGMVFQDADTQIVSDTVFDEVSFGLENLKFNRSTINEKVLKILHDMKLLHLKNRNPATLSGGEKKKLIIAGVLVMEPDIIVFDEPFSNLDYPACVQILNTIVDLNRSGQTIIIAAHDVETVIYHASRIIILEKGCLKKDGTPVDMIKHLESYGVREPCSSKFGKGIQPWLN